MSLNLFLPGNNHFEEAASTEFNFFAKETGRILPKAAFSWSSAVFVYPAAGGRY